MGRGARTGLGVLFVALVGVAVLGATGVVRIPYLNPASDAGPAADRPEDLAASAVTAPGELAAAGGRPKAGKPGEVATAEPALPSEVKGTAIPRTGGTIRGRVVETEAKRPVAGAVVELLMPEALFHYLRANPVGRFDRLTAMTDAAGRFEFAAVLPATDYALRARKGPGPYATKRGLSLSAREVLDAGDLVLGPSGGLSGHVVGADGKGLAGARVAVTWAIDNDFNAVLADPETLPWTEAVATSDADGAWKVEGLEPGEKTLVAKAPSGAADAKASISVVAGTTTPGIDWTLGGALAIAGRVEWADGKPIEGARVFAKTMQKPASFTVESAADGTFRLPGLADGVYFVGAFIPGMSVQLLPGKKAGDENVRIVVPLAGALSGRVVSKATGRPIPQFKITPVFADKQDWMQRYVAEKVGKVLGGAGFQAPDGAFRFDRLTSGSYTLHVEAEGYPPTDSAPVEVIAGAEAKAGDVALADGNRISGVVRDAAGVPIAGATVSLRAVGEASDGEVDFDGEGVQYVVDSTDVEGTTTDEVGAFRTEPLTPRAYLISARKRGFVASARRSVDVATKSAEGIDFRLPRGATLTVRVADPRGRGGRGVPVAMLGPDDELAFRWTGDGGTFEMPDLLPGRWSLGYAGSEVSALVFRRREDPATFAASFRAAPGVEDVVLEAGATRETSLRVPIRVALSGTVRLGARKSRNNYFRLTRDEPPADAWIGYESDGGFRVESIEPGRYRVFRSREAGESGESGESMLEVGSIDIPSEDRSDFEIDLSK